MQTKTLKKLSLLVLILVSLWGCQTESLEVPVNDPDPQSLSLKQLPPHIQAKVTNAEGYFLNLGNPFVGNGTQEKGNGIAVSRYQGASFGAVNPDQATHTVDRVGNDAYALAMERGNDPRAIDNMVVVDRGNGEVATFIVRHLPTDQWFLDNPKPVDFGLEFSGTLQVFDEHNGLIATTQMDRGQVVEQNTAGEKEHLGSQASNGALAGSVSTGGVSCSIASVEKVGLQQGNVFYIYEFRITFRCTSTGSSGGGGNTNPFGDSTYGQDGSSGGSGSSSGSSGNGALDFDPLIVECPEGYINAPVESGCINPAYLEFEQDYRSRMSTEEKRLFDKLSAKQKTDYLTSAFEAQQTSKELFPSRCEVRNGLGDAYRHALWNALSSRRLGAFLTGQLTTAHEERPHNYAFERKEKEMDLFNNSVGRNIGVSNVDNLARILLDKLNAGELRYLNNLSTSCRATNESQLIKTNQ